MPRKNPQQMAFARDLADLINYAHAYCQVRGYYLLLGEAWRPDVTQEHYYNTGFSKTKKRGTHGWRMAQDLVVIDPKENKQVEDRTFWEPIGDYWKSRDEYNRWGGDIDFDGDGVGDDLGHFERRFK